MNGAVRAVVRMGIYMGAKVYFIHEVRRVHVTILIKDVMINQNNLNLRAENKSFDYCAIFLSVIGALRLLQLCVTWLMAAMGRERRSGLIVDVIE